MLQLQAIRLNNTRAGNLRSSLSAYSRVVLVILVMLLVVRMLISTSACAGRRDFTDWIMDYRLDFPP